MKAIKGGWIPPILDFSSSVLTDMKTVLLLRGLHLRLQLKISLNLAAYKNILETHGLHMTDIDHSYKNNLILIFEDHYFSYQFSQRK